MAKTDDVGISLLDSMIPFMFRVGSIFVGLVAVAAAVLYAKQDSLLYFPEIGQIPRRPSENPRRYRSPEEHHLPFETHRIKCADGVYIHSWLLLQPNAKSAKSPTLIFFHGNAGNIGLRLPNASQMYNHLKANILMVDYRGYGDSDDARPTEAGLKLDAEASLRFMSNYDKVDPNRIFIFGRSLGGAVGFHLAQYAEINSIPLAGLIVENTFLSISAMVDLLLPWVAPLKGLILRIDWKSIDIAPTLKTPILYLAGAKDELVPHSHMLELYKISSKSSLCARLHVVKDGRHNETWIAGKRAYWEKILSFFEEVITSASSAYSMESVGSAAGVGTGQSNSAIPVMPTNFIGMVQQAATQSSKVQANVGSKKD